MEADILTKVILPFSLFLIMFGMGLSLRVADFKAVVQAPKAVGLGIMGQMLLLPLMAFMIAVILELPPEIAVGLMIIALAPGGATSNMFTYLFKGDVSLSISLTAVVSLITPFTIPIITVLSMSYFMGSSTEFSLPIAKTIMQLLVITVLPVLLGMWVLSKWESQAKKIENALKWFSIFFLFLIMGLILLKNKAHLADFFAQSGMATLILNLSVLFLGYALAKWAKLSKAQSTSIGFEVGIQNGTLALVVAGTLIGNSTMMIPAVTYALFMFPTGALFGWWLTKRQST